MMKILSDNERERLILYLTEHALDQVLIDAVAENIAQLSRIKEDYKKVNAQLSQRVQLSHAVPPPSQPTREVVVDNTARSEPPGTPAGRIGARTLAEIKSALARGRMSIEDINKVIKGRLDNTTSLMKLLWVRNIVEWDDPFYRLKG